MITFVKHAICRPELHRGTIRILHMLTQFLDQKEGDSSSGIMGESLIGDGSDKKTPQMLLNDCGLTPVLIDIITITEPHNELFRRGFEVSTY